MDNEEMLLLWKKMSFKKDCLKQMNWFVHLETNLTDVLSKFFGLVKLKL